MRRARDLIGLPVLDLKSGNAIGWIQDVVFDSTAQRVSGLLLENGHIFRTGKGLPRSMVAAVGKDALTVKDNVVQDIKGIKWTEKVGNQIFTQGGEAKGTIQDVFLDDSAESIVGFEVSDGLFSDLIQGRGAILQENVMIDGKDVLIVEDHISPWDHREGGSLS
ncbi:PRC-barrel domain-containing protein [Desulfitobacterium sp.]|uniref:PRC-barrel domain-containing protein n=1 Tax=Desulfitobacterium sp. TaxID=49981 RepID=UPI002B20EABF|nr:PRC-barrel domain-containing protein [Desulfitobacterium sp.]MEA4900427.1 PRC-barrel domain-containing protein [Desulfitobacterium sp.]